jgi:GT2 family glycosyltransferase
MSDRLPPEVADLLARRSDARGARDFELADALRERIRRLGWEVVDAPGGSSARPALPEAAAATGYARREDLESLLEQPATVAVSVVLAAEDHADDLRRCLRGMAAHSGDVDWELLLIANAPSFDLDEVLASADLPVEPVVLTSTERLGWADARNLGLRRSRGEVSLLLDTSVEPLGDFLSPLLAAFDVPSIGLAGGWGVTSRDGRQFEEAPPGEVDAIEAYCLAVRRDVLRDEGLFDHRFRFYRNADIDFSFQARAAGWRAVVVGDLPLRRHEQRDYAALPHEEVHRLSRRNFYRFLKHWGDRRDLLLHPAPPERG